ncbi:scavenger receptor class B member 1 isoform X3 [Frankliniella occidentalis]|uniref:Scavenger receptor class B member 1 n=1 Tax=Frankliniella occidentalis TaxID=133901 RepID=A0A9C6WU90_FRAOC|nr:scavenger receptor class B member 1 isoform X3 [Frankliniella occidentalis]
MQGGKNKLVAKLKSSFLRKWWFVVVVSLALIVFGAIVAAFFTSWVDLYIEGEIVLKNGSQTFGWWKKPPVHPVMRVYIYNVTNADAFLNNAEKPVLNELGPYVYVETWEKVAVAFNDNGTVSFQQKKVFRFDPEQSVGDIEDMVVVPNIPMLSATSQSKHAARFLRLAMASIMDILKIKPFVEVSVGQLLWGYEDPLLKLAKDVVPKEQKLPYEEFGLMYGLRSVAKMKGISDAGALVASLPLRNIVQVVADGLEMILSAPRTRRPTNIMRLPVPSNGMFHNPRRPPRPRPFRQPGNFGLTRPKNGTAKEVVTIFTGATDITRYGLIDRFDGKSALPHWKTDECNRINGSDGSIFPPHITKNTTLYVYDKDMCRLLPLRFLREVVTNGGVNGYRFTPPENVFAEVSQNPENDCFCPNGPPCSPHGLMNVSFCQYDSPVMLSFPHFYLADPKLREAVIGVDAPDPEKHRLYIDVHPKMGTALGARARVQINLAVSQVVDIKQVATFPDIVFPIMWFEDGIDGLPEEVTGLLALAQNVPPVARSVLMYGLFAVGGLLLILAVGCLVRSSGRQETLNLEGTQHYAKPNEKNGKSHSNGKSLETRTNPAFEQ